MPCYNRFDPLLIHTYLDRVLDPLDSLRPDSLYRWARPRTGKAFQAFKSHCPFLSLSFPQPVRFPGMKLLGTFQKLFLWTLIIVIVVVVETFQRFLLHCIATLLTLRSRIALVSYLCTTQNSPQVWIVSSALNIKLLFLNIKLFTTITS